MKLRSLAGAVTAVLAIPILGITGAPSAVASPAATIVNIYPGNAAATGWSSEGNQENGGTETFVNGPATPPLGTGSLQLSTPAIADKAFFGNANLAKTPISDLSAMSYSTYVSSAPAGNVALPSYQVPAEANGTTGFTTLVYEPYNQHGASIVNNTWQTWDALNGGNGLWWSTHARGTLLGGPSHLYKWSDIVNALPDATILSIGANLGSHNAGVTASVDAFSVGVSGRTTTYNFELQAPTSL
ncbi:MAG: hypothetical protein ACRD0E_12435, partial [Acidimicrobiales bacterium]